MGVEIDWFGFPGIGILYSVFLYGEGKNRSASGGRAMKRLSDRGPHDS
jgi:hypothetical protein